MSRLFGTGAPIVSDVVAVVEVSIAVLLVVGAWAVRRGHVRVHQYLQSTLVLVNLPVVLSWMVPQYVANVLPGLPGGLASPFYLVPTLMLFAGGAAEVLGVYILLVAGTNLLPERLRFRNYRLWMRAELGLWWGVVVLGLTTYTVWYVLGPPS